MSDERWVLEVGRRKGEWDFGVSATIGDFTYEDMNHFRAMCMVAIWAAEDIWQRNRRDEAKRSEQA